MNPALLCSWPSMVRLLVVLLLVCFSFDDIPLEAQAPCPTIENFPNYWAPGSTLYYAFTGWDFSAFGQFEQNQIVQGLASWTSANQNSNGTNITFAPADVSHAATLTLALGPTQPNPDGSIPTAAFQATQLASNGTIQQATITFHLTNTFPDGQRHYQPTQPGGSNFLTKLTAHEAGHGMGMNNVNCNSLLPNCWSGDTVMGGFCGVNDQDNCLPSAPTPCDNTDVRQTYNTSEPCNPPAGCSNWNASDCVCEDPAGDGCISDADCSCGGTCNPTTGNCMFTFECSPIIIALGSGANLELTGPEQGVWFDISGDGKLERMGWTRANDAAAFLASDLNQNGLIDNGFELFGNHTRLPSGAAAANGFTALAAYDMPPQGGNGDGFITAADSVWHSLRLWIDWDHNAYSEANELYRLEDWDLTQISLDYKVSNRHDAFGNEFRQKAPCRLAGAVRFGYDVYFSVRPANRSRR